MHHAAAIRSAIATAARTIIYRRGADVQTLRAAEGKTDWQQDGQYGQPVNYQTVDFLFAAADLGPLAPPQDGDTIEVTRGADLYIYGVRGVNGEPPWRAIDPDAAYIRTHTDLVDIQ